jgi:putative endonuclease
MSASRATLLAVFGKHRSNVVSGFVKDYGVYRLVFVEFHETMTDAILREKRIKKWRRAWKLELIESQNPLRRDVCNELAPLGPRFRRHDDKVGIRMRMSDRFRGATRGS